MHFAKCTPILHRICAGIICPPPVSLCPRSSPPFAARARRARSDGGGCGGLRCRGALAAGAGGHSPAQPSRAHAAPARGCGGGRALRRHHVPGRGAAGPGRAAPQRQRQRQRSPAQRIPLAHARCLLPPAPPLRSDGASAGERQGEEPGRDGAAASGRSRGREIASCPRPGWGGRRGRDLPAPASMMEGGGYIREVPDGVSLAEQEQRTQLEKEVSRSRIPRLVLRPQQKVSPASESPFSEEESREFNPPSSSAGSGRTFSSNSFCSGTAERSPQPRGPWGHGVPRTATPRLRCHPSRSICAPGSCRARMSNLFY